MNQLITIGDRIRTFDFKIYRPWRTPLRTTPHHNSHNSATDRASFPAANNGEDGCVVTNDMTRVSVSSSADSLLSFPALSLFLGIRNVMKMHNVRRIMCPVLSILQDNFFLFDFHPVRDYSLETIYINLPRLCTLQSHPNANDLSAAFVSMATTSVGFKTG